MFDRQKGVAHEPMFLLCEDVSILAKLSDNLGDDNIPQKQRFEISNIS